MKKTTFITLLTLSSALSLNAGKPKYQTTQSFNLSNSYSASGQGLSTSINYIIDKNMKGAEFGVVFQTLKTRFSGFHFKYKHYIDDFKSLRKKNIFPFIHASMFLNSSVIERNDLTFTEMYYSKEASVSQKVSTIEWYIGPAGSFLFRNKYYINVVMGIGGYTSSYKSNNYKRSTIGITSEKGGFSPFFELSTGINLP